MKIENKEFKVHVLNEKGIEECKSLAFLFDELLSEINSMCEPSRELSIVKTKLEEACFFAKKCIASKADNQR